MWKPSPASIEVVFTRYQTKHPFHPSPPTHSHLPSFSTKFSTSRRIEHRRSPVHLIPPSALPELPIHYYYLSTSAAAAVSRWHTHSLSKTKPASRARSAPCRGRRARTKAPFVCGPRVNQEGFLCFSFPRPFQLMPWLAPLDLVSESCWGGWLGFEFWGWGGGYMIWSG